MHCFHRLLTVLSASSVTHPNPLSQQPEPLHQTVTAGCVTPAENPTGLPLLVTHSPLLQLTPHHAPLIHCVLPGLFSVHQRSLPPQDLCTCYFLCQDHFHSSCGSLLPTIHDSAHSHLFGKDFIDLPHHLPGSVCFH